MPHSTGKERDAETGLDYFLARYYSGAQGRFLSVDPENAGAKKEDPQSWNAYAYSRNNPLKYVDPDGKLYELVLDYPGCYEVFELSDSGFEFYKHRLSGQFIFSGGVIYSKKYNYQVGTYRQIIDDRLLAIKQGAELAGPTVKILALLTGAITGGFAALEWVSGAALIETLGPILPYVGPKIEQALERFGNGPLSNVGRALTKHPKEIGETGNILQKLGGAAKVNDAAAEALRNILANGQAITKYTTAFGRVIDIKLPNGIGARFSAETGNFIGFLGRGVE
jgi:RHS repeat-associated protein